MDTRIHTRIDSDLKAKGDTILKNLGMTSTEFIRMTYHQLVMRRGIPFDVLIPNDVTIEALSEDLTEKEAISFDEFKSNCEALADEVGKTN